MAKRNERMVQRKQQADKSINEVALLSISHLVTTCVFSQYVIKCLTSSFT